jgi:hypothetical protein
MNDENANTETPPDITQGVEPDPMEAIAAGLYEIFGKPDFPRQQVIRVGWKWLDKLQGTELKPEEEPVFDPSDIENFDDWFDWCIEQIYGKAK